MVAFLLGMLLRELSSDLARPVRGELEGLGFSHVCTRGLASNWQGGLLGALCQAFHRLYFVSDQEEMESTFCVCCPRLQ